jgi:hypothetical protein
MIGLAQNRTVKKARSSLHLDDVRCSCRDWPLLNVQLWKATACPTSKVTNSAIVMPLIVFRQSSGHGFCFR